MAEERKMTFTEFMKKKGEKGVREVTISYATNNSLTTMEKLAEEFNVSATAVSRIIRYAIENLLVTYQVCIQIKEKSHLNQIRHISGPNDHTPSDEYYNELLSNRLFKVRQIRDERLRPVLTYYLNYPSFSVDRIAKALGYGVNELNILLKNSIVFGIATDEEVQQLIKIAISKKTTKAKKARTQETFNSYLRSRHLYERLQAEIRQVKFQLESFDDFHFEEEGGQTKEDLEAKLKTLQEKADTYYEILL